MPENSLSAAIAGKLEEQQPEAPKPKAKRANVANQSKPKPKMKAGKTVLVGGHFPPAVLKQLRIIAAEDDTTNQALLEEALDLLFVKRGKAKIDKL